MKTHPKKRVDIVVEATLLDRTLGVIDRCGASGYTVLPCLSGRGREGTWRADDPSAAFGRVWIMVVVDATIAERLVEESYEALERYSAVVTVTDVEVVRGSRF